MFSNLFSGKDSSAQDNAPRARWEFPSEGREEQKNYPLGIKIKNRALGKTLKFRAVTLVTTLGITWLLTGNPITSISLTAIQQSTNTAVYYFFENREKSAK